MALLFARRGAIVVLCDINEIGNAQTAELVAKELASTTHNENRIFSYTCDIGNRDEVQRLVEKIQLEVGEITMVVNNGLFRCSSQRIFSNVSILAAILSSKSILDMGEDEFSRCLDVNLFAAYWVSHRSTADETS